MLKKLYKIYKTLEQWIYDFFAYDTYMSESRPKTLGTKIKR